MPCAKWKWHRPMTSKLWSVSCVFRARLCCTNKQTYTNMVLWCDTVYTVSHQQRLTEKRFRHCILKIVRISSIVTSPIITKKWILKRSRKNIIWNIWQGHFLSPPPFTERKWRSSALCSLPVLCKSCSPPATKKCRDMKQWWLKYPDPETLHPMQMQGLSHLYHEAGVCLNIYHVLCEAQPLDESKPSQTTWTKSCHP